MKLLGPGARTAATFLLAAAGLGLTDAHAGHDHHHHHQHGDGQDHHDRPWIGQHRHLGLPGSGIPLSPLEPITMSAEGRCGTKPVDALTISSANADIKKYVDRKGKVVKGGEIDIYFHVIYQSNTSVLPGGYVPKAAVQTQMDVLNAAFRNSKTGYQFVLKSVTYTQNSDWFNDGYAYEKEYKQALHQGGRADLNIYSVSMVDLLGFATFPWEYAPDYSEWYDGVVLNLLSIPGIYPWQYALGETLTHEVGHWMGLWHTFQGECGKENDFVLDTPREETPAFGCPIGRNTCPQHGKDPIFNYMDYSDDACYEEFSKGQNKRMWQAYSAFRLGQ